MSFGTLRILVLALAVLAQVYLFFRISRAIWSIRGFRHPRAATLLVGIAIGLLFAATWRTLRPIPWVDPPLAAQVLFFYAPAVWSFGSIFSAFFLFLTQVAGWLARFGIWGFRKAAGRSSSGAVNRKQRAHSPQFAAGLASESKIESPLEVEDSLQPAAGSFNIGRRRFLQAGVAGIGAAPFLVSAYGAGYEAHEYPVEELTLPFGLPLRAVQLTDIHAGLFMTPRNIQSFVNRTIALEPDLLLLTGDYISNSAVFFPGFLNEVARIKPRYGTFATLGNHDNWYGAPDYFEREFRKKGIHFLQNAHRVIETAQGSFAIAGIDDLYTGDPDLLGAFRGLEPGTPVVLLSHRPEIFPLAAVLKVPLTLSGHYHGGQIKLRLFGMDISPAHLRSYYPEGLYRIDASHLYVSRGIGTTFTPVRLNAPPEITLFHLI